MFRLSRRSALIVAGLLPLLPRRARANTPVGTVAEVTGDATLTRDGTTQPLTPGTALSEGDTALTAENALALLILESDTRINMGAASSVVLSRFAAATGGSLNVSGAIVFDRPEDLPPIDLAFETAFGQIAVRGTRFFVGPSKGAYAVFCQRGRVTVTAAGTTRDLGPGDGVDLAEGAPPGEVGQWGEPRIRAAFESVGLTP